MSDLSGLELRKALCEALGRHDMPPLGLDDALSLKVVREWCDGQGVVMEYAYFPGRAGLKHEFAIHIERQSVVEDGNTLAEVIARAWLAALDAQKGR